MFREKWLQLLAEQRHVSLILTFGRALISTRKKVSPMMEGRMKLYVYAYVSSSLSTTEASSPSSWSSTYDGTKIF